MIVQDHLAVLPIVLPLAAGALTLVVDEARQSLKAGIAIATAVALIAVGVALVEVAGGYRGDGVSRRRLGRAIRHRPGRRSDFCRSLSCSPPYWAPRRSYFRWHAGTARGPASTRL